MVVYVLAQACVSQPSIVVPRYLPRYEFIQRLAYFPGWTLKGRYIVIVHWNAARTIDGISIALLVM
jgi:hypothetical protein